ncbi:MAG: transcription termination factor NusA [Patescibacteria group bacterium]|nr:transcription termination factor NusA [Patescibacteria group bacterium]MDD5295081.1 transcription termination factor NusA [Patescibacteria group bacterium]MDD5554246.1 transcription termination factor NusA [Patescibacteria group bacterium]
MSDLSSAIKQICEEKGLDEKSVITTIESALAAAYRKDFGEKNQNIKVEFDPETGKSKVFDVKTIVEDMPPEEETETVGTAGQLSDDASEDAGGKNLLPDAGVGTADVGATGQLPETETPEEEKRKFNPKTEIQISDAKMIKKTAKVGDEIKTKLEVPAAYGRMAAQTAKQVIVQRLREAEREMVFGEFKDKEKEVVSGVVQRHEGRFVLVDLGRAVGYLPAEEQIFGEKYTPGERIKVYIKEVRLGSKGPEIILSRTSDEILKKVFYLEIPEISNGLVELKAVAREAGARSKVAVATDSENVDPIGSCVGQRGSRIQTIISELGGEKIDIIQYDENPSKFIGNALSPAKIISIKLDEKEKKAYVKVMADQLSLAIGKNGQNARLAARLTGWKIDIGEAKIEKEEKGEEGKEGKKEKKDEEKEAVGAAGQLPKKEKKEKKEKKPKEKKAETPDDASKKAETK